jgi:hypothetical protein
MNAHAPIGLDHRETADNYQGEIFRSGRYRIVIGNDCTQWVLQRQRSGMAGMGAAWDGIHYFRRRETAIRLWREVLRDDGTFLLAVLPERIARRPSP